MNENLKIFSYEKDRDYSLLPDATLLRIFTFLDNIDLYQLQQVCVRFKVLIENELKNQIKCDWRLEYLKFEKFKAEISSCGAIMALENAKKKNGKCSVKVTKLCRSDMWKWHSRRIRNGFNEVTKI